MSRLSNSKGREQLDAEEKKADAEEQTDAIWCVKCPAAHEGPYVAVLDFSEEQRDDPTKIKLAVDGLTGCMGTICVQFDVQGNEYAPKRAMLMHDPVSGNLDTKDQLEWFMKKGKKQQFAVIYGFGGRSASNSASIQ
jgi:hypothetical protein